MRGLITFTDKDDGAAVILVVLTILVLFGVGLLAVDAGGVWVARQSMVTATDAVALGAASYLAQRDGKGDGCGNAETLLQQNATGAMLESCQQFKLSASAGYVTVTARSAALEASFGKAFGMGSQTVSSMSSAVYGPITTARALRPIGLCLQSPHIQGLLGLGPDDAHGVDDDPSIHRFTARTTSTSCSADRTTWMWMDFNGGESSTGELHRWMDRGYSGLVGIDDCDADGTTGDGCKAYTIEGTPLDSEWTRLENDETTIAVAVYDPTIPTSEPGTYKIAAFVGAVVRGHVDNGGEGPDILDLEFKDVLVDGLCCDTWGSDSTARGVRLCAFDHDSITPGARCATS